MDENTWRIVQIAMWMLGIQTAFLGSLIGFAWSSINKKLDKSNAELKTDIKDLSETITDIDKRLCRLEGAFSSKDCCFFKDDQTKKKVE